MVKWNQSPIWLNGYEGTIHPDTGDFKLSKISVTWGIRSLLLLDFTVAG